MPEIHTTGFKPNDVYKILIAGYFGGKDYMRYLDSLFKRKRDPKKHKIHLAEEWSDPRYQIKLTGDLKIEITITI